MAQRNTRPAGAPDSWIADALRLRGGRCLVRLQLADKVIEGLLDDVQGDVLVLYCERSFRRISSAAVNAFSVTGGANAPGFMDAPARQQGPG